MAPTTKSLPKAKPLKVDLTTPMPSDFTDQPTDAYPNSPGRKWHGFLSTAQNTFTQQWQQSHQLLTDNSEKANTLMMNTLNDYSSFYRDMTSAAQQYCQTWTKGCEELSRSYMSFWQSMTQDCMSAFKSTLSARTMQDAVSTQSDFMRTQYEKIASETAKMSEQFAKTASEAAEPVQSQWSTMTSKMTPSTPSSTSRAA